MKKPKATAFPKRLFVVMNADAPDEAPYPMTFQAESDVDGGLIFGRYELKDRCQMVVTRKARRLR